MLRPNVWSILTLLFFGYIGNSIWSLYTLYHPKTCDPKKKNCLVPAFVTSTGQLPLCQLRVYTSTNERAGILGVEILKQNDFNLEEPFEVVLEVEIPDRTLRNGSLYAHVFLLPNYSADQIHPQSESWHIMQSSLITTYMTPKAETFKLVSGDEAEEETSKGEQYNPENKPTSHLRTVLPLGAVSEPLSFEWDAVPPEIYHLLKLKEEKNQGYLPLFFVNELAFRVKDLVELHPFKNSVVNFTVKYEPVSVGKLRLLVTTRQSLVQLRGLGFTEKDVDEVKSIFTDTNFYFLALTFAVAAVHILLDFLAFKNDIHFWRGRKTMVGLSSRALLWRAFSQSVIFLYLLDEETSMLVLIPTGIGTLIEYWKVTKAYKVRLGFHGRVPRVRFGAQNEEEVRTEAFDSQGMHYLVYLLVPLCVGGAVYSLLYVPHKSWVSWVIQCAANGVYAFGFLFMLPQLFVNYKLKSVAHLPWRAFMYKAFNTFIDDLFAFIITMPTAHRVACFRDDVVFVVYLYQRYLYPVDKTRVNEFGESFEPSQDGEAKKHK